MRQRILKSFFVAVIQIMHGTFCHAGGKKPAKPAKPRVRCGELYGTNPDSCGTNCGLEKWTVGKTYPCDLETNRNYGCYEKRCWRSDADKPEKRCYTGAWCWDGKNDDNHTLCKDQILAPCGEKPQRCGELNMKNPASCGTSCGIKKWTDRKKNPIPCNSTTNRNYGCYKKHCWRSDAFKPKKSCYTGKWCWDGENDDNHELCKDQTLSLCGEKHIPEGKTCGELYLKNQASCNTSCGMKKWNETGHPCNTKTNRNYGCDKTQCWRSDADNHEKRCYTSKGCWDNKHNVCEDQILAPCGEKLEDVRPEGVRCGELNMKNPASCNTTCGVKKYTVDRSLPCDTTTNRNYGCSFKACWRSDAEKGWCYTNKWCQNKYNLKYKNDHLSCHGQTLLPCDERPAGG